MIRQKNGLEEDIDQILSESEQTHGRGSGWNSDHVILPRHDRRWVIALVREP